MIILLGDHGKGRDRFLIFRPGVEASHEYGAGTLICSFHDISGSAFIFEATIAIRTHLYVLR